MRRLLAVLISGCPLSLVRIFLYRALLGYEISYRSKISWGVIIDCQKFVLGRASSIGLFSKFSACSVIIGESSRLKRSVSCSGRGSLVMGCRCVVNMGTHFDVTQDVIVRNDVVFGGRFVEVWTHGYDWLRNKLEGPVFIASKVYIGSGVKIMPAVTLSENIAIGAGTVVSKSVTQAEVLVVSQRQELKPMRPLIECNSYSQNEVGENVVLRGRGV